MTTADAPALIPTEDGLPTVTGLPAVKQLLNACAPGWRGKVIHAEGSIDLGGLSDDTDGDGKRSRISRVIEVESVSARLAHLDGRQVRVLWYRDPTERTKTDKPVGFGFDLAYRGRHDDRDELAPAPLNFAEVKAYVGAVDHAAALDAVLEVRAKQAAAAAKAQATRKRNAAAKLAERVADEVEAEQDAQLQLEQVAA